MCNYDAAVYKWKLAAVTLWQGIELNLRTFWTDLKELLDSIIPVPVLRLRQGTIKVGTRDTLNGR